MEVLKILRFHGYNDYENYEMILDENASKYINKNYASEATVASDLPVSCNIPSDNKAYWIKKKYISGTNNKYYNLCKIASDGTFGEGGILGAENSYNSCIHVNDGRNHERTNGLRVIVTLNDNIKTKGKIGDMWYLY